MIVIYAGAILVTYVFVMMLAHHGARADYDRNSRAPLGAVLAGFVLTATIAGAIGSRPAVPMPSRIDAAVASSAAVAELPPGNTVAIGASILGPYIVPLEVAGVLLLVAMIGALAVARKKIPVDMTALSPDADRPLGQSGREAPPFSPELKEVT
jgi:NADH-quinone oxidoreductase subunit J